MRPMPATTARERILLDALSALAGAEPDRTGQVLRNYVLAQRGPFKSEGRGQFDDRSLMKIVLLAKEPPAGLRSRFTHPSLSSDGLGSYLGRAKNVRLDGDKVRGDLHFDPTAFNTPRGNLAQYVMDLAASDPDALSSSLVLSTEKVQILDEKGKPKADDKGDPLPPIWRPTKLHASDIVDTGDAVDGLLSARLDRYPSGVLARASQAIRNSPLAAASPQEMRRVLAEFTEWMAGGRRGPQPHRDLIPNAADLADSILKGQSADVVRTRLDGWASRTIERHSDGTTGLHRRLRAAEIGTR